MADKVLKHKGKKIVIKRHEELGTHCVFVKTLYEEPHSNPYKGKISPGHIIEAYGGLTYSGKLKGHKGWYFGIDFAHIQDYKKGKYITTEKKVIKEAKKLAEEVIKYEKIYDELQQAHKEMIQAKIDNEEQIEKDFIRKIEEIKNNKGGL